MQSLDPIITHMKCVEDKIHVFYKKPSLEILASYPPQMAPDEIWKEVYGVKDGVMTLLETVTPERKTRTIETKEVYLDWNI